MYDNTISLRCTKEPKFEHVSLEAAKNHARVDIDDDDALLTSMIAAARKAAEGRLHRVLRESIWEWKVRNSEKSTLEIPVSPCFACQSVSVDGDELDSAGFSFVPSGPGGLSSPLYASLNGLPAAGITTVTVRAGYPKDGCPQEIIQWMLVKITGLYEQREAFVTGGSLHEFGRGFVDHLLDPYILP